MPELISPELALVDPDLAARARAALPVPDLDASLAPLPPRPPALAPAPPSQVEGHRPYPAWARITAALWLLVLGILIGGAAIPHAQDAPRVVPPSDDPARLCEVPRESPSPAPSIPDVGSPLRPGANP